MNYRRAMVSAILLLLSGGLLKAVDLRIGLFYDKDLQSIVFTVVEGEYVLYGNNLRVAVARKGSIFHIERTGAGLSVQDTQQSYGTFGNLELNGMSAINVFLVKPVLPSLPARESDDNLIVSLSDNALQLINRMEMEKYVAGTVESEGGPNATIEYYKAQAVLIRTFARKNFYRHAHEGFNLCDDVHCQAYKGKSRLNKEIFAATLATKDQILADAHGEPVITAYHANCGGITASASMIWNKDLPYLIPVKDPFCNGTSNHDWNKSLSREDWNTYLSTKGFPGVVLPDVSEPALTRQKFLDPERIRLPMTQIRDDLKLKSSYFTLHALNGQVEISGHGYGHGLGLCQDGAIEMARVGYCYVDILMFYFHGLKLVTP